jgi:hypothetical protein
LPLQPNKVKSQTNPELTQQPDLVAEPKEVSSDHRPQDPKKNDSDTLSMASQDSFFDA